MAVTDAKKKPSRSDYQGARTDGESEKWDPLTGFDGFKESAEEKASVFSRMVSAL